MDAIIEQVVIKQGAGVRAVTIRLLVEDAVVRWRAWRTRQVLQAVDERLLEDVGLPRFVSSMEARSGLELRPDRRRGGVRWAAARRSGRRGFV